MTSARAHIRTRTHVRAQTHAPACRGCVMTAVSASPSPSSDSHASPCHHPAAHRDLPGRSLKGRAPHTHRPVVHSAAKLFGLEFHADGHPVVAGPEEHPAGFLVAGKIWTGHTDPVAADKVLVLAPVLVVFVAVAFAAAHGPWLVDVHLVAEGNAPSTCPAHFCLLVEREEPAM